MLTPNAVPDFTRLRVAVVGDFIVDHYLYAEPIRVSREAPVLVLRQVREEIRAGGSANVARNLWALGAQTRALGAVARDRNGRELLALLDSESIDVSGVATVADWVTPTKTRILAAEMRRTMQQVVRVDREPEARLPAAARAGVAERIAALEGRIDVLICSDYTYGTIDEDVMAAAAGLREKGVRVVLDPRRRFYPGVTAITPNAFELAILTGRGSADEMDRAELAAAASEVLDTYGPEYLLVTLGNEGMILFSRELPERGVAVAASGGSEVIDASGAGDTAVATFALALAAQLEPERAMRLANTASGIVVMESGTAVCSLSKLRSALPSAPRPETVEAVTG